MTNEKIIIQIDDEDILELIPDYLEIRRDEMSALRDAAAQKDFETLRGIGHKMKGSGGGYGLDRISEIGSKLESSAKEKDISVVEKEIADLQDYLDRVEVVGI
jgi:HPt (histidine-containing phosphotransfer) domain-containing protein